MLQYLLIGLLTVGMLLPCMSVEAKAAINFYGSDDEERIEKIKELEKKLENLRSSRKNGDFQYDPDEITLTDFLALLVKEEKELEKQIEYLLKPPTPTSVTLEGDINGVTYPITIGGLRDGDGKVVPTIPITYAGKITFTEDCRINNLHVLAADSVTALPGVDVEVDTMIIIGNNTKVSNLKVNNLITPQSASQAAKQSYNLLAPKSPRVMSAEEALGWGKDLFGAQYQSFPTEKEIEDLKTLPYYPRPKINVPSAAPTDPVDPSPQGPTEPTP